VTHTHALIAAQSQSILDNLVCYWARTVGSRFRVWQGLDCRPQLIDQHSAVVHFPLPLDAGQSIPRRVAISNSRLVSLDARGVTFRYKDYRRDGRARFRTMTLTPNEFIGRFLLHVLPSSFHRIRHYGLLASATCKANVVRAKELIAVPLPSIGPSTERDDPDVATGAAADHRPPCPCCGGRMIIVECFGRGGAPRAPPSPKASSDSAMP